MIKKKRKGYAFIFVLGVMTLLLALSAIAVSVGTASYIQTSIVSKNNKLKLAAESGIDRSLLMIKNYLLTHSDAFLDTRNFNLNDISVPIVDENGIKCTVTLIDANSPSPPYSKFYETSTGRNVDYILIRSVAQYNSTGQKKTIDSVIDKNDFFNVYFNRLFKSSFTVADEINGSIDDSCKLDNDTNLSITGELFLQGNKVTMNPHSPFNMDEGDIYVNAGNLVSTNLKPQNGSGRKINLYESKNTNPVNGWKSIIIKNLQMLGIIDQDLNQKNNKADKMQDFDTMPNVDDSYIQLKGDTLITYKVKRSTLIPIDFQKLIDGDDLSGKTTGVYKCIINLLKNKYPTDYLKQYGTYYKVLLVDGNLDIPHDPFEEFNNYIIYCTGTVTFKGSANFYNSSIFAKKIIVSPTAGTTANIVFNGVKTQESLKHQIDPSDPNTKLEDFSETDKGIINNFLIDNLDNYGDYILFKTLEWKEY